MRYKVAMMVALCISATSFFIFGRPAQTPLTLHPASIPQPDRMPDHNLYAFVFAQATFFNNKAADLERAGKGGVDAREFYHRRLNLTEQQGQAFEIIKSDCELEVTQLDEKARQIISAFRMRFPGGVVPRGEKLPPPPPELAAMQQQRNTIFLRARDRLRVALGDQKFAEFEIRIKKMIAPKVSR